MQRSRIWLVIGALFCFGSISAKANTPSDIAFLGTLTSDQLKANPAHFLDGIHLFEGPPFGLLSTVTVPITGRHARGRLVAEKIASNIARRQLVAFIEGEDTEAIKEQISREDSLSEFGDNDRRNIVKNRRSSQMTIRTRSHGSLIGVEPVARWVTKSDGEALLHVIFFVAKDNILQSHR